MWGDPFGALSNLAGLEASLDRAASSALTLMQGAPALFLLVTAFHVAVRGFLSPLVGRAGASLAALALTAGGIAAFFFEAAGNPAAAWALLAWAANAAGAAAGEAFRILQRRG